MRRPHRRTLFACVRAMRTPDALLSIARDFSPRVERHGASAVVLDVAAWAVCSAIRRRSAKSCDGPPPIARSGMRIAVAPTQTAARLLASAMPRLTVSRRRGRCRRVGVVADSRRLRVFMDRRLEACRARASRRGVQGDGGPARDVAADGDSPTLGELAALPRGGAVRAHGAGGLALQQLARGSIQRRSCPIPDVPRFVQSMELEWPIDALEPLSFVLARLLDPLSSALERADRGAAALRLDLRLVDRTTHARVLQLPAAMRDARCCARCCCSISNRIRRRPAIDIVTIEIDPAPARIIQYSLLERALPSAETLATLTARLGALVGEAAMRIASAPRHASAGCASRCGGSCRTRHERR